jgi:probable rRNA maturation factor
MIQFLSEKIELPPLDIPKITRWIKTIAAKYNFRTGNINYIFCDDEKILEVNNQFLEHDYYTDIITFDYSTQNLVAGDIFISVETVQSNAQLHNQSFDHELKRVIIHGLLHLTGQADGSPDDRAEMIRKENEALMGLN